jgi:riboflavin synthase
VFTGLVQAVGAVAEARRSGQGVRLFLDPRPWPFVPLPGDSISVAGCCLTLAAPPVEGLWAFDVVAETLSKTTLENWGVGAKVNLEPSATPATLLGGHIVQGHVDGVGEVTAVSREGEYRVRIRPPKALMEFVAPKGSICVDGVSLTIAALSPQEAWFEVALIPTTLEKTTLSLLKPGDRCNLEADAMAKAIVHWLKHYGPK